MLLRNTFLAGAAIFAAAAVSAPAQADNITSGTWYAFGFSSTGTALFGGGAPGTNPNGVSAPTAPWTITLTSPETLTVVDVEASGDQFTLFDNGVNIGTTSAPGFGSYVGECISCALADSNFSRGTFTLGAGTHSITGVFDGFVGYGDGDFQVSGVPEPAAWALMLVGFGALGTSLRARRKASSIA